MPSAHTADEAVEAMTRWEDDGGQNVGADYEWLSSTEMRNQPIMRRNGHVPERVTVVADGPENPGLTKAR